MASERDAIAAARTDAGAQVASAPARAPREVDAAGPWTGPIRSFDVPIERGMLEAFAHAVGQADRTSPPPSFVAVADRFDPDYPRRPPLGRGWQGDGPETLLHVEQWLEHHAPVHVGETLVARRGPGRRWAKQGRSGALVFAEERTELRDAAGGLRIASGWVDVHAAAGHARLTNAQRERAARGPIARRTDEVAIVEGLTPTQIVLYVAAAGDFHPLHHDDAWARARGYPSIFAPGMLTLAWTAGAVLRAGAIRELAWLASRFRAQVWPGDSLYVSWAPWGAEGLAVRTRNQRDETVLETQVRTVIPEEPASVGAERIGERRDAGGSP